MDRIYRIIFVGSILIGLFVMFFLLLLISFSSPETSQPSSDDSGIPFILLAVFSGFLLVVVAFIARMFRR